MTTKDILQDYAATKDNLLMILHDIQQNNPDNRLSEQDIKEVAAYLNTTYAAVYGVITYYSMLSVKPRGKNIIRVCRSPICRMVGATDMLSYLRSKLMIDIGGTTQDKIFTLETTECLGQCDKSPVLTVNEDLYTDLDTGKIDNIIEKYRK
ncbi:MAG: NAD(P)H-dependent oxidoreductase subunit E [Bacteroidales bacterium]